MKQRPRWASALRERGSALIATIVIVGVITIAASAILVQGVSSVKYSTANYRNKQLKFAAIAGIQEFRTRVGNSLYGASGNLYLRNPQYSQQVPAGGVNVDDLDNINNNSQGNSVSFQSDQEVQQSLTESPANDSTAAQLVFKGDAGQPAVRVNIHVFDLGNGLFQGFSTATHLQTGHVFSRSLTVNERSPFSDFLFFTDEESIAFGTTTVRGDVHDNVGLLFYFGGFNAFGDVSAVSGFDFLNGATEDNTQFFGLKDPGSDPKDLPTATELDILATRVPAAETQFLITETPSTFYQNEGFTRVDRVVSMQFQGTQVAMTIRGKAGSADLQKDYTFPLPVGGLIFSDKSIESLSGDVNGRTTIATRGGVSITNPIRYIDNSGNTAYQLYQDDGTGTKTATDIGSTGTDAWTQANGYTYESNPNYNPGIVPSVLGIISKDSIVIADSAPFNMSVDAALFSFEQRWNVDLTQGTNKGNWRFLGSMTTKLRGWRYSSNGDGYALSGEYIYDEMLTNFPPPHYLTLEKPTFGATFSATKALVGEQDTGVQDDGTDDGTQTVDNG